MAVGCGLKKSDHGRMFYITGGKSGIKGTRLCAYARMRAFNKRFRGFWILILKLVFLKLVCWNGYDFISKCLFYRKVELWKSVILTPKLFFYWHLFTLGDQFFFRFLLNKKVEEGFRSLLTPSNPFRKPP